MKGDESLLNDTEDINALLSSLRAEESRQSPSRLGLIRQATAMNFFQPEGAAGSRSAARKGHVPYMFGPSSRAKLRADVLMMALVALSCTGRRCRRARDRPPPRPARPAPHAPPRPAAPPPRHG